jgi:shikimate dehydrogenase
MSDATPPLAAVLGWPVGHSLSPRLHGHWFARYGIAGSYVALPVRPADLALAFRALPKLGFSGWNVTLPHKEAALGLVDSRDASAERTGTVNTVTVDADGRTRGYSTDGAGFIANLRQQAPGWRAGQGAAVLVGTGGAARAVALALIEAGVKDLRLTNRTAERAAQLRASLQAQDMAACVEVVPWSGRAAALEGAGLCINATSLGMAGQPPLELDLSALPVAAPVADLVYVPLETPLLRAARARGHAVVDGLGMLIHQAVPGFAHWGGIAPEVDQATRRILLEQLSSRV